MSVAKEIDRNRWLIIVALWVPLLFTVILAFLAHRGLRATNLDSHRVLRTVQVKDQLEHLNALVKDVESSQRGYLLTEKPSFLSLYEKARKEIPGQIIPLAEDDPRDAKLTLNALEGHHLANKVFIVNDGEAVLDYLYCEGKFKGREGGNPVALLLDLKMPKVDGLEVLKITKADRSLKTMPVSMLTSSRETPDLTECYGHGVNAYVVKPVDFDEFAKAVNQLGFFWTAINEPPPPARKLEPSIPSVKLNFLPT
jgi:CheY-like chemotaxis protein